MNNKYAIANKDKEYVTLRCKIDHDDVFSRIIIMSTLWRHQLALSVIAVIPIVLLVLFTIHFHFGLVGKDGKCRDTNRVRHHTWGCLDLYTPLPPYDSVVELEWSIIGIMILARYLPRLIKLIDSINLFYRFAGVWIRASGGGGRLLLNGVIVILIDKIALFLAVWILSACFTFFGGDKTLFFVVYRFLMFEFLLALDTPLIEHYLRFTCSRKCLEIKLYQVQFPTAFFLKSDITEDALIKACNETTEKTNAADILDTFTSTKRGFGANFLIGTKMHIVAEVVKSEGVVSNELERVRVHNI